MFFSVGNDAISSSNGAPAGHAGGPGESGATCRSCHAGPALTAVPGIISSTIPATGYVPGQTYTISAAIARPGHTKFGFQISPQNVAGTKMGTMIITNPQTKLVGGGSKYITHTGSGNTSPDSISWSFDWTAPAAGSGEVTFYGAFNVTNANNNTTGDTVITSSLGVQEEVFMGTRPLLTEAAELTVFPNPATDQVSVSYHLRQPENVRLQLLDILGRPVADWQPGQQGAGAHTRTLPLDRGRLSAGIYVLQLQTASRFAASLVQIQ